MGRTDRLTSSYWPKDTSRDLAQITLGELLRRDAAEVPERVALVEGTPEPATRRRWTYAQLLATSEQTARALLSHFEPGERVAICAPNCPEWILLQLGASLAGMILVPMNPAFKLAEIEFVLRSAKAAGIFFTDTFRDADLRAMVLDAQSRLPDLRQTISLSRWDEFVASGDRAKALPHVTPDQTLQIQFTSGTTGFPKGACLHHCGVINSSHYSAIAGNFPDGGVWINAMPMFHIGGVATEIGCLARRGSYVLMPGFDPALMLELFESERGVTTLVVPTMLHDLLNHPDMARRDLSSLRTIACGASAVPASLIRRAKETLGCKFTIPFGQTELSGIFSQALPGDSSEDQCETVGRPLPNVEVKIGDPVTGEILPIGAIGEICVRGYQAMSGFFGLPEESRKTLGADGWLRMGDLGTMDDRGYLRITGRLKDMIIRGGANIYPLEIENLLVEHPAVAQASVVGIPDEKWGEVVAAVILAKTPNQPPTADELHAYCRAKLASYKTPSLWFFVTQFPLNATGKIQKFTLQEWIKSGVIAPTVIATQKDSKLQSA